MKIVYVILFCPIMGFYNLHICATNIIQGLQEWPIPSKVRIFKQNKFPSYIFGCIRQYWIPNVSGDLIFVKQIILCKLLWPRLQLLFVATRSVISITFWYNLKLIAIVFDLTSRRRVSLVGEDLKDSQI